MKRTQADKRQSSASTAADSSSNVPPDTLAQAGLHAAWKLKPKWRWSILAVVSVIMALFGVWHSLPDRVQEDLLYAIFRKRREAPVVTPIGPTLTDSTTQLGDKQPPTQTDTGTAHVGPLVSLGNFEVANPAYFDHKDVAVEVVGHHYKAAWGFTTTQSVVADLVRECEQRLQSSQRQDVIAYLREELARTPSHGPADGVADGAVVRAVIQRVSEDVDAGLAETRRELHPVFDVTLSSNDPDNVIYFNAILVRTLAYQQAGGDAGDVASGGVITLADTIVVKPPLPSKWHEAMHFDKPLRKTISVNTMSIPPKPGALRFRLILDMSDANPGAYVFGFTFRLSDGHYVDSGDFVISV